MVDSVAMTTYDLGTSGIPTMILSFTRSSFVAVVPKIGALFDVAAPWLSIPRLKTEGPDTLNIVLSKS